MSVLTQYLPSAPPPPPVVLARGDAFFVRRVALAEGEPVEAQVTLALEGMAPFPPEQLYHGHLPAADGRSALVFAAFRRRFEAADTEAWTGAALVTPDFVSLLVTRPSGAGVTLRSAAGLLTALAGIKAPSTLQGQSLVPMLNDPAATGRGWALTQVSRGGGPKRATITKDQGSKGNRIFGYSLRTPRYRYTEWDEGRAGVELYDHDTDPQELANLAQKPEHAATVKDLSQQVREAAKSTFPASGTMPEVKETGMWAPNLTDP
jgi:hypothetical protein